jgi:hypothetical protein
MTYSDYLLSQLKKKSIAIVIIVLFTIIAYGNTMQNAFAWDDGDTIIRWEATRSWKNVPAMLAGATPPGHPGNYRPIRNILYIASYHLFGLNPTGYHIQAIILTIAIAILVYLITDLLVKSPFTALVTGIFFALHPMHVEAFTWITSSMDMFGMLFGFGAIYTYLRWRITNRTWQYTVALLLTFLAIFSNEVTLSIPILIALVTYLFPTKNIKHTYIAVAPFFLAIVANWYVRVTLLHIGARFYYIENSIWKTFLIMLRAFWVYVQTLVFPTNLTINHALGSGITSWSIELIEKGSRANIAVKALTITDPIVLLSFTIIFVLFLSAVLVHKKHPIYSFAVLWFFISMIPVSNLIPTEAMMTERYAFLASYGYVLMLALLCTTFARMTSLSTLRSRLAWATIAIIILFYTGKTIQRNSEWQHDGLLWQTAVARNKDAHLPHLSLASYYVAAGNVQGALDMYLSAVELSPNQADIDVFIAAMYHSLGKDTESVIYLNRAIKKNPWHAEAYFRLGNIYKTSEQYNLAISAYANGLKIIPDNTLMLNNLGVVYSILGKYTEAKTAFTQAITLDPNYESAKQNLEKLQREMK